MSLKYLDFFNFEISLTESLTNHTSTHNKSEPTLSKYWSIIISLVILLLILLILLISVLIVLLSLIVLINNYCSGNSNIVERETQLKQLSPSWMVELDLL